jgi:3-oxo-5-alpha-steroid 4-dehydrogenase 1
MDFTTTLTDFYPTSLWIYAAVTVITFVSLFFVTAPYGRHMRAGWGPSVKAATGWFVMELVALLTMPLCALLSGAEITPAMVVFLLMWCGHYTNRALIDPWRMRHSPKEMPFVIMSMAVVYNVLNGFTNGWNFLVNEHRYGIEWLTDPRFILGVAVFILGTIINFRSDKQLRRLRTEQGPGYHVPQEGLHQQIASPNYFGEIVEWLGFAIATWSLPGLLFALYTFANLAPRARGHLKWYRENFPDYPRDRKAIIPYIW